MTQKTRTRPDSRRPDSRKPAKSPQEEPQREESLPDNPAARMRAPGPNPQPRQVDPTEYEHTPAYPLFPELEAGELDGVRVFRLRPKEGRGGYAYAAIELPWEATALTSQLLAQVCGGGRFMVQAIASGRCIKSVTLEYEGPERRPTASDVALVAPGLALDNDGTAVHETRNGWLALNGPGITPGIQASFLLAQQSAFYARQDAQEARASEQRAYLAMCTLMQSMSAKFTMPDPAVAVTLEQLDKLRAQLDSREKDLAGLRKDNEALRIEASAKSSEKEKLRSQLMERGLTIVDSVSGAVLQSIASKQQAADAAAKAAQDAAAQAAAGQAGKALADGLAARQG